MLENSHNMGWKRLTFKLISGPRFVKCRFFVDSCSTSRVDQYHILICANRISDE